MKIDKWLSRMGSDRIALAVVRVEAGESAVMEDFLALLDGDSVGHYGISAELVKTGDESPEYYTRPKYGLDVKIQFGYDRASSLKEQTRYFKVNVSRD